MKGLCKYCKKPLLHDPSRDVYCLCWEQRSSPPLKPGDEVWVRCRFGDYSTLIPGRGIVFAPWDKGVPHLCSLSDIKPATGEGSV